MIVTYERSHRTKDKEEQEKSDSTDWHLSRTAVRQTAVVTRRGVHSNVGRITRGGSVQERDAVKESDAQQTTERVAIHVVQRGTT